MRVRILVRSWRLENLMDEPAKNRKYERAQKCRPESRDDKPRHDECHRPKKERVENDAEYAECNDGDWEGENFEHRPDDHRDDRPHERHEERGLPTAGNHDAGHDGDGERHRGDCPRISKHSMHGFIVLYSTPQA